MTIKEIWEDFKQVVLSCLKSSEDEIKKVAKTSFELLKTTLVDLVKGIYNWLLSLIEGVAVIGYNIIKVVGYALYSAIKATLGLLLNKVIEWIEKL